MLPADSRDLHRDDLLANHWLTLKHLKRQALGNGLMVDVVLVPWRGFSLSPTWRQWELGTRGEYRQAQQSELSSQPRPPSNHLNVLKALELERVFGHDLLDGTVRVNVHLDVFGQLMRFKADKRVQQTHEVAQCRVIARNVEAAPPLYLSENVKKNQRIIRVGALTDFRGWVQNQRRLDRLCRR